VVYLALILFFVAVGALVISFMLDSDVRGIARMVGAGAGLVGAVLLGISAAVTVQPGHVGVPVLFGEVQEYALEEGFHFVNPFVTVDEMTIQTQTLTMSGDTALRAMSSDQLTMTLDVSILYHLNSGQAPGIRRFMPNYSESIVVPSVRTAIRDAVREFDAVSAVSENRDELGTLMMELVRVRIGNALNQRELERFSVHIDDVQLRNIVLPAEIQESIRNVQRQRQQANERQQSIRTAQQEAERAQTEAEGARQVALIGARRDAESRLIRARAEAEANDVLTRSITPEILRLRAIDATRAITTSDQTRTVVLGSGSGQTPLILNMGQ
jgi:regulator of protease activity HflC (stomatin/prohibitin superfamily)